MITRVGLRGGVAVLTMALALSAAAQQSNDELKKEVETLKEKVKALEEGSPQANPAGTPVPISDGEPKSFAEMFQDAAKKLLGDVTLSGFVDVGYVINTANPENGLNGNLPSGSVRCFDQKANSLMIHNAQLALERVATEKQITGFKLELTNGRDADVIDATGDTDNDYFDIQEAYVQFLIPFGKGVDLKVGKMATLAGMEVIEAKDNYNYSRSLAFFYAIPFTHAGVRGSYQALDQVKVTLGLMNGWDILDDNNDAKTAEFQVAVTPLPWLSLYANSYWGSEQEESGDKRFLLDLVAVATPIDKWTFGANYDWARDQRSFEDDGDGLVNDTAEWSAWALYVKHQLNDWYAPGVRASRISDLDGARTGEADNRIWEWTLTNEFKVGGDVVIRVELRHDKSNHHIFQDGSDEETSQNTLGLEVIFIF